MSEDEEFALDAVRTWLYTPRDLQKFLEPRVGGAKKAQIIILKLRDDGRLVVKNGVLEVAHGTTHQRTA